MTVDATTSGNMLKMMVDEAYHLLEEMLANNYHWPNKGTSLGGLL